MEVADTAPHGSLDVALRYCAEPWRSTATIPRRRWPRSCWDGCCSCSSVDHRKRPKHSPRCVSLVEGWLAQDALAREVEAWSKAGKTAQAHVRAAVHRDYPQSRRRRRKALRRARCALTEVTRCELATRRPADGCRREPEPKRGGPYFTIRSDTQILSCIGGFFASDPRLSVGSWTQPR
jgi:hypothetical protein